LSERPARSCGAGQADRCVDENREIERALYDRIGCSYTASRQTDPRLAALIWDALGDAETVLNVGAGAGAYEPPDRTVLAVEPSAVMLGQRPANTAPAVQASAESLPFADDGFDAAMAVLATTIGAIGARGCGSCVGWRAVGWCSSTPTRPNPSGSGSRSNTYRGSLT
jgi:hypothetical protein